jgi:hypothetical protein
VFPKEIGNAGTSPAFSKENAGTVLVFPLLDTLTPRLLRAAAYDAVWSTRTNQFRVA